MFSMNRTCKNIVWLASLSMDAHFSVETNIYFGMNRISNIILPMKIERIEYWILFAHEENIRILFEYLKIFEYSNIFE